MGLLQAAGEELGQALALRTDQHFTRRTLLFNPALVQAFMRATGIYPVGTLVRLESGRLGVVVDELDHLLQSSDFDAIERFRELKTLVAGTVMESDFDEVGRLVGELRFSAARECLRQVFARTSGVTE